MKIQKFLDSSPLFGLAVAYDEIIGDFQKRLAKENVHFLQALILTALFFEERPVRPTELAKVLRAQKSNLSHALRSLERAGLLERKTKPDDARAYLFVLTKEGKKKIPRLIKLFDSTEDQLEKALGGKRLNAQMKAFTQIYRSVKFPSDNRVMA